MPPVPEPGTAPAAVDLNGLTKRFTGAQGTVTALDGLSASVTGGQVTGVVGADAAGKTTLLRVLAGLLAPSEGEARTLGHAPGGDAVRGRVGYMPQSFGLYAELSVYENLRLHADLQGLPNRGRQDRFDELMAFAGLAPFAERRADRLSGGMRQKLGLACTLVHPPELLLLDEPTVGVDPVSRRELWTILYRLVADGMTVVVSTAYLDEAERCPEVLLLHRGRLLAHSDPDGFAAEAAGRTFVLDDVPAAQRRHLLSQLPGRPGIADSVAQGRRLRILLEQGRDQPPEAPDTGAGRYRAVAPRFEDAFIARLVDHGDTGAEGFGEGGGTTIEPASRKGSAHALAVSRVDRRFGDFYAVRQVSFDVRPGEIFGLLGPNGAGKSTLIKMICGLLPPSAGAIRVAGVDASRAPARVRSRLGYMAQQFALYEDLSPVQNLRFFCRAYGLTERATRARIEATLADFALEDVAHSDSATLPLGLKQRLALGNALLHRPEMVLLDEPTSGVDPLARRGFWRRINELAEAGVTVLVTTHFLEEAEYCDQIGIIHAGQLAALDTPDALRTRYTSAEIPEPTLEDAFVALIEEREGSG